jgi:hypothetical protein
MLRVCSLENGEKAKLHAYYPPLQCCHNYHNRQVELQGTDALVFQTISVRLG